MVMTPQSYCQPGPRRWPNYGRGYETQREINKICIEHGCDRGGRYAHLFDPELPLFYDRDADDAPPEVSMPVIHPLDPVTCLSTFVLMNPARCTR